MRAQKASKKRLEKLLATRHHSRARRGRTANLERASNEAIIKLMKRIGNIRLRRPVTHGDACQLASEILRTTSRKFGFREGWDEFRHMRSCLIQKADQLTGHFRPELYYI